MRDQSDCMDDRPNEELNQQENESAVVEVPVNTLQNDKHSQNSATDSNLAAASPQSKNHNPVREGGDVVNLIKSLQQKPRRKKHRPEVITEGKPRPRKQAVKSVDSKDKPTVKRKYVRKKASYKTSTAPVVEVTEEATDQTISEPAKTSCRRSFNFDMKGESKDDSINRLPRTEQEPQDNGGGNQSKSVVHLSQGIEVIVNKTQCGIACDFDYPVSRLIQDYSSPAENQVAGTKTKVSYIPLVSGHVYTFKSKEHLMHIKSKTHSKLRPLLPKGLNCCAGCNFQN